MKECISDIVFSVVFFFMVSCVVSKAQVFIVNDNMTAERLARVEATVLDSLTNDSVAFASVYVIPVKDTSITNFTLSDVTADYEENREKVISQR